MKFIYEHDEQDDYIEVQLTQLELKRLMEDIPAECSEPACINTRRLTNVYIRRMPDAINQEQEQESDRREHFGTRKCRAQKEPKCCDSPGRSKKGGS